MSLKGSGLILRRRPAPFQSTTRVCEHINRVQNCSRKGSPRHPRVEPRAVLSSYDAERGHLTVWTSNQQAFETRAMLAQILKLEENKVRVVAPMSAARSSPRRSCTRRISSCVSPRSSWDGGVIYTGCVTPSRPTGQLLACQLATPATRPRGSLPSGSLILLEPR